MKKRGKGLTGFSMQKRFFILFSSCATTRPQDAL